MNGSNIELIDSYEETVDNEYLKTCAIFIKTLSKCLKCRDTFMFNNEKNICVPITDKLLYCKEFDQKTKNCISCIDKYSLSRGICCIWDSLTPQTFDILNQNCT